MVSSRKRLPKPRSRYSWRDVPALALTAPGRTKLRLGLQFKLWPLARAAASRYRRLALNNTRLIAVTGSFGKSTTTKAVAAALGNCPHAIEFNHTSFLASRLLCIAPGSARAVLEVGLCRGPGYMAQQAAMLRPQLTVVTSIGGEHNTAFATLYETREEKAEMVRILPADGLAVLNGDDPHVRWMASQSAADKVFYGFAPGNQIRANNVRLQWPAGTRFSLHTPQGSREVLVKLLGRHSLYSVLAAVAVGLAEGRELDEMLPALEALEPLPGRMQPVRLPSGAWLLRDDYKSPRETIETCLDFLAQVPAERRIVVMGNISEVQGKSRPQYRALGLKTGSFASRVLFYGDGNYSSFKSGLRLGGMDMEGFTFCHRDIGRVIDILRQEARPGDLILLKGRGNQRLQRAALALMGRQVRCDMKECYAHKFTCDKCPRLSRGWRGLPRKT